jgi:hypothetical protein
VGEQPVYHNGVTVFNVIREGTGLECRIILCITGIGGNMLLIAFLSLITNSLLVSGECNGGTPTLNSFDWNKVGICRIEMFTLTISC